MRKYVFDIWDSTEKRLYKDLDQFGLAAHHKLLARNDCHMIQHLDVKAYNGRTIRHADVLKPIDQSVIEGVCVVAWDSVRYVYRSKCGQKGIYLPEQYEVLDNKIQQIETDA